MRAPRAHAARVAIVTGADTVITEEPVHGADNLAVRTVVPSHQAAPC